MAITGPWAVLDVATTAIDGAADYLEPASAPSTYKDPVKIAEYVQAKTAERAGKAALDLDLARISMIGLYLDCGFVSRQVATEIDEAEALRWLFRLVDDCTIVTFNGLRYDLPLILRRCLYLGVTAPDWPLDRYRTPHVDLWQRLSLNGQVDAKSLGFYARRLGWTDLVKPLSGAEEAAAPAAGRWDELRASVEHDVRACHRLAQRMGVIA